MPISKPCLNCGNLTTTGSRCDRCQRIYNQTHQKPKRPHYRGDYKRRARQVCLNAEVCWICGKTAKHDDPWTADHVIPGDPDSPLLPAHRSCNSSRGNRTLHPNR